MVVYSNKATLQGRRDSECSSSVASVEVVSVKKHKAAAKPDIAVIAEVEDDAPEIVQEVVEVEKESSEEPEVVEEVATKATEDEVKVIGARQIVGEVVAEAVQHTESTKVTEIVEEEPVTSKTASKVTHPAQEKENRPKVTSNLEIKAKVIPKGKPKSGRFWKSDRDRFRSVIKSKGLKMSFEQRLKRKEEMIKAKAFEQSLKDEVKQRKEDQKRRREENAKRREENQKKSEVVEIVSPMRQRFMTLLTISHIFFSTYFRSRTPTRSSG